MQPARSAANSPLTHANITELKSERRKSMRQAPKRQSLNLRIKVEERGLIDCAAKTLGKNRTDFVLDAARRAAEDALLDRTIFTATPKAYAEFLARLDAPPQPNERLRKTLRS